MLALRVLTLFVLTLAVSPAALGAVPRAPRPESGFFFWKQGGLSTVYRHASKAKLVKIIGARALPEQHWVNYPAWLTASKGRISDAQRRRLTDQTMGAYAGLRADRAFASRYRHLLPTTRSPEPGRIEQTFVSGLDWDALAKPARQRAGREMARILASAKRALPGEQVDYNKYNFVFDEKGAVLAWVDWVISDPR